MNFYNSWWAIFKWALITFGLLINRCTLIWVDSYNRWSHQTGGLLSQMVSFIRWTDGPLYRWTFIPGDRLYRFDCYIVFQMKHEASCKNIQKKRKVFDMTKQRVTEDLSLKQIKSAQKKVMALFGLYLLILDPDPFLKGQGHTRSNNLYS